MWKWLVSPTTRVTPTVPRGQCEYFKKLRAKKDNF